MQMYIKSLVRFDQDHITDVPEPASVHLWLDYTITTMTQDININTVFIQHWYIHQLPFITRLPSNLRPNSANARMSLGMIIIPVMTKMAVTPIDLP